MSDDQRVYSDEEFGLILRKATELASRAELAAPSSAGLTLAEMKAAAAQVGFDPALVERAAQLLVVNTPASSLERLVGGPLRHNHEIRFPITLDETGSARLLSAVRISAGQSGSYDGHSSAMGMTWHDGGDMEALRVSARPEDGGTAVSVVLDRRGTLGIARGYWASSTRKARERISVVMDAIGRTLTQPETKASALRAIGESVAAPTPEASGRSVQ